MLTPLFPNSSYLLALGANPEQEKALREAAVYQRLRTFFCANLMDLQLAVSSMRRIMGLITFGQNISAQELAESKTILSSDKILVRILNGSPNPAEITKAVDDLILELIPPELEPVLTGAASQVFPALIEKAPKLAPVNKIPFGFDRQFNFSLVAGDVLGQGVLRVKLKGVENFITAANQNSALEILQEAMNQTLGLVVQKLVKIGYSAKSGLPTLFDITSIPELQSLVFFPSVHLMDETSQLAVSLGFFDVSGKQINFKGINDAAASEEVEFL